MEWCVKYGHHPCHVSTQQPVNWPQRPLKIWVCNISSDRICIKAPLFCPPLHLFDSTHQNGALDFVSCPGWTESWVITLIYTLYLNPGYSCDSSSHTVWVSGAAKIRSNIKKKNPALMLIFMKFTKMSTSSCSLRLIFFHIWYLTVNVWLQMKNQEAACNWMLETQESID